MNAGQSTTANIVSAVNTLAAAANSTCPVTAVVTGAGGTITQSSSDENTASLFFFPLTNGINFIQSDTAPGLITGDYTFALKDPISAGLTTNNDFNNEEMRIAPITSAGISRWLNSTAVTGI